MPHRLYQDGVFGRAWFCFEDPGSRHSDSIYLGSLVPIAAIKINALAHIEYLEVIVRSSSFFHQGRDIDILEISSILGADTAVEGSVRQNGDRLRITAQIVNTNTAFHLLSERYDKVLGDSFAIQDRKLEAQA